MQAHERPRPSKTARTSSARRFAALVRRSTSRARPRPRPRRKAPQSRQSRRRLDEADVLAETSLCQQTCILPRSFASSGSAHCCFRPFLLSCTGLPAYCIPLLSLRPVPIVPDQSAHASLCQHIPRILLCFWRLPASIIDSMWPLVLSLKCHARRPRSDLVDEESRRATSEGFGQRRR